MYTCMRGVVFVTSLCCFTKMLCKVLLLLELPSTEPYAACELHGYVKLQMLKLYLAFYYFLRYCYDAVHPSHAALLYDEDGNSMSFM